MFMNILDQKDKQGHFQCLDHSQDRQTFILFKGTFMKSMSNRSTLYSQGKLLLGDASML